MEPQAGSCPLNAVAVRKWTPFLNWKRKERDQHPQAGGGENEAPEGLFGH